MTPQQFVQKWSKIQIKETSAAQSHFNDVCALVGHQTPTQADPTGQFLTFEAATAKTTGQKGRADVWYKGKFIWEYKGPHANLDKAYQQLLLYRESLGNPPLLIVSDLYNIIIHTNFQNTIKEVYEISFDRLLKGDGVELLKQAFFDPESFRPLQTQAHVTEATAETFVAVIESLKKHQQVTGQQYTPEQLAHFVIRLLFCLFAEDLGLLPHDIFTQLVKMQDDEFTHFRLGLQNLFNTMRTGGVYGFYKIRYFDGGLFDDEFVPELPPDLGRAMREAVAQDWSAIDPSIFGTLFERVIDEDKRAQLGAHYTSKEDILLIVEPVLMQPLRDEWVQVKQQVKKAMAGGGDGTAVLQPFAHKIASTRVLDPACGSGNFLYMALRQLLDLQKEVIVYARQQGAELPLTVSPSQLYGIEINPYAHELAQITVWIGYLQWRYENGFVNLDEPILRPLQNIERKDAILAYDENGHPVEPIWPEAEVIIGNPPFLGGNKIRQELGDKTVDNLFGLYNGRIPAFADLVCYWFEKARAQIEHNKVSRAGLIATNSIRGGVNREVLKRIKETGDMFMAWSDKPWTLDGAAVRVSIVGFDNGKETTRFLNSFLVLNINPDLTSASDLSEAKQLPENAGLCVYGSQQKGSFDISSTQAREIFSEHKSIEPDYHEVVKPSLNGLQVLRRGEKTWVIDFGVDRHLEDAQRYKAPFEYIQRVVYPERKERKEQRQITHWWLHARPSPRYREFLHNLKRYIVSPATAKYRIFVWLDSSILADHSLIVYGREDDYFLGVLHSKTHELWALRQGTSLEDRPRYTPSTTFETFPFPWPPGREPAENEDDRVFAIAQAARELNSLREAWLNPPGVGTVISEKQVNKRTLTNLYNALTHYRQDVKGKKHNPSQWEKEVDGIITLDQIQELDAIHTALDRAVLTAYGWPAALSDEQILERLLALNLERSAKQGE